MIMSLCASWRWTLGFAFLAGVMASRTAGAQKIAPAGVRSSHFLPPYKGSENSLTSSTYQAEAAYSQGYSRATHILFGTVGGLAIGVYVGSVRGRHDAKQCHTDSCVAVGLNDMIKGGLFGALLGSVVGTAWPVRQ